MAKHRVYEVARSFEISSNALLQILAQMGVSVKGHMSVISEDVVEQVRQKLEEEREAARQHLEKKRRLAEEDSGDSGGTTRRRRRRRRRVSTEEKTPKSTETTVQAEHVETDTQSPPAQPVEIEKPVSADETAPAEEPVPVPASEPVVSAPEETPSDVSAEAPAEEPEEKPEKKNRRRRRRRKRKDSEGKEVSLQEPKPDDSSTKETKTKKDKKGKKDSKKSAKKEKELAEVKKIQQQIKQTLAQDTSPKKRKYRKKQQNVETDVEDNTPDVIQVSESLAVLDLARFLDTDVYELINLARKELGLRITANQRLDVETIEMIALDFGFEVERVEDLSTKIQHQVDDAAEDEGSEPRAPIVTIMGHVDHGKTSLLDYIRRSKITESESGGITQHVGAYEVVTENGRITFLDTPGHEAFTAMRARGANVTDIVILVVAADDGLMPQTIEAIDHAKAANVPIIVAVNKIDLPAANPDKVRSQLAERGLIPEEWGGDTIVVNVSAHTGEGVDKLLEMVSLQAEIMELKANPNRDAVGVVVESRLDPGKGAVVTVLVQQGTLKIRDSFVTGIYNGRVRAMKDDQGNDIKEAGPSKPVVIYGGLAGLPNAGDSLVVVPSERKAKEIAQQRQQLKRQQDLQDRQKSRMSLTDFYSSLKKGEVKTLKMVVKADVNGSVEALSDSLLRLTNDEVEIEILHKGVGAISENDVMLASASDAIIIGFHVDAESNRVLDLIKREGLDFRRYEVIYELIDDVRAAMEGLLEPDIEERRLGVAEVRAVFRISRTGTIAGCYVLEGTIRRDRMARLWRGNEVVYEGKIDSLKRFKEDVREVQQGYECGIGLLDYNAIEEGDRIEAYEVVEVSRKLEG